MSAKTTFNKVAVKVVVSLLSKLTIMYCHSHVERYDPKHDTFIVISNHSDGLDPVYELYAFKKYIRLVMSDHLVKNRFANFVLRKMAGFIIRDRDKGTEVMVNDILESTRNGISVSLYAEGTLTPNGETGFFSPKTGQLVKDSGVALITFKVTGGYLHTPKWGTGLRRSKTKVDARVVREYSPQELREMTVEEVNEAIKNDIYVNFYEDQKEKRREFKCKNQAEYVERVLYMCPHCEQVSTLHSKGDFLTCDCGYKVELKSDGFFHPCEKKLIFDNILDWDKWQKEVWKRRVLKAEAGELIFEEKEQRVSKIVKGKRKSLSEDAVVRLYQDRFEILLNDNEKIVIYMNDAKLVMSVSTEALVIMDKDNYLYIRTHRPRATSKYVAAWRFLNGKEYK